MTREVDFYLGRLYEPESRQVTADDLRYDPGDLTTHAVVMGMTGSGKTGLCLDMLEEAALNKLPALMIDPKGDITNAILHFPELLPEDFRPWIDPDQARRENKTLDEAAAATADLWRNGLASWDIGSDRIRRLKESVQFAVYTPGSDAGLPVSILASLAAPSIDWTENREIIRERIASTATSLLSLVGLKDIDPVRSREHILLANIFERAWSQGHDLTLGDLIMQTQSPPFSKLGVFEIDAFFPQKDRFDLAMQLNNILAAPSFQSWIEGQDLDVQGLLYTPEGKPRHSIFYIAHLNDAERMFFVSLLFSAVETWMRAQGGSTSLRTLIYFDEILGYLPPIGNPPSKGPMLRLLKQARAFGVGLVLATQNPVDVDYKALSNAGTWFIGKLQTDQDKSRLLDGLTGASGAFDRRAYDNMLSGLGKRVFLLHNVHESKPILFQTRWAMNYLAGPLTRNRIPQLNELAGITRWPAEVQAAEMVRPAGPAPTAATAVAEATRPPIAISIGQPGRPTTPSGMATYFLPVDMTLSQAARAIEYRLSSAVIEPTVLYRPALLLQATTRFSNRKYNLHHEEQQAILIEDLTQKGPIDWERSLSDPLDPDQLMAEPAAGSLFAPLNAPLLNAYTPAALRSEFQNWVFRTLTILVKTNEALGLYGGPNISEEEFQRMCQTAADERRKQDEAKIAASFDRKIESLQRKLALEEKELAADKDVLSDRKREEVLDTAHTLVTLFTKKRLRSTKGKSSQTRRAKQAVEESKETIVHLTADIERLVKEKTEALADSQKQWSRAAEDISVTPVPPYKKDIIVSMLGLAWSPYYLVERGGQSIEIPAFL
jgi:hypothetical protein